MFGGGGRGGSFGAMPSTQFGSSVQASPGNNSFPGGNNAFGGPPSGGNAFGGNAGGASAPFGGGGRGGRTSYPSTRGGRSSYRGGRSGGGRYSTFPGDGGSFNSGGRGGRGGRGSFVDSSAGVVENPFAQASPSATGGGFSESTSPGAVAFGQPGRGREQGGGRFGGRGSGGDTVFGGGANMAQPNIRRKSDFGGRGPKTQGTTFGQAPIFPPLPPTSPPPFPQSTHKPGRGIATPVAAPTSTTFGQQSRSQQATTGFGADTADVSANPFGGGATQSSRTEFGRPSSAESGFAARAPRENRQSNAFVGDEGFHGGFQGNGGLEARLTGGRQQFPPQASPLDANAPSFGVPQRRKSPVVESPSTFFGSASEATAPSEALKVKPRKKVVRATPQSSPPPTPAPADNGAGGQIIGDQKNKAELSSAENLDGTCVDMCSQTERDLHVRVDELSVFEKCFPGEPGRERDLIVKRFQRSSADHKLDIPSELRPLGVLRSTQLYLEQQIMDRELLGPDPRFNNPRTPEKIELYNFCWDRFRMIRKDFVLQNYRGAGGRVHPIAVDVHERIARYHILSEHELVEVQSFVAQQNMEQLGQTLKSLNELYDESRKLGDPSYLSPFEAEFRGYFILCTLDNGRGSDVLKFVKGLPPQIRDAPQVKFAMQVFVARHTQDYYQFFKLLQAATYLQACLVFRYIPSMRSIALERMNRAFRGQPFPLADLGELLCFDDLDHAESVCAHHGLDISASEDDDGELLVNFGGEFDTDMQLRQNKNPLPARSSHVYVGGKRGDFLRRDVCRGVTEYEEGEYPALSKLIKDTEEAERSTLYPSRPPVEDEYSAFAVYSADPFDFSGDQATSQPIHQAVFSHSAHQHDHVHVDAPREDHPRSLSSGALEEIARKKAENEQQMLAIKRRLAQLERAKEEQERRPQHGEQSDESEREAKRREAEAKAQAEAEAVRRQEAMEAKIREEEAARQREQREREEELRRLEERKKAAAEQARVAELQRLADEKRQAEQEQKRREMQRLEDESRRKAAVEDERRRKEELAAEQARRQLEAERRAEMAREAARLKQLERLKKQRLAVLKLKFHVWRKFVAQSKALPRGVSMEASSLADQAVAKPNDVVNWLFSGSRAASDFIGLKRRQFDTNSCGDNGFVTPSAAFWRPLDVASIAGQAVGQRAQGWKFVVADVLDGGLSSFGSWCAIKCGIASASLDEDEQISTVHAVNWSDATSLAVCCRYLDGNFVRTLSSSGRAKKLAGTSGLLLPLDLSHVLDARKLRRWEERVRGVLAQLHPTRRVGVVVLGFCAAKTPRKGDALAAAEAAIQQLKQNHEDTIAYVDGELIVEDEISSPSCQSIDDKIASVLYKMASSSGSGSHGPDLQVVDFAELVDSVVDNALQDQHQANVEGVMQLQDRLHAGLWKLREVLHSPSVIDVDAPIPELQATLGTPSYGWNSREAQQKWEDVLTAMTSHRIVADRAPQAASKVCETYFEQIQRLVDGVFAGKPASTSSGVSVAELKQSLFGILVPVHDELVAHQATDSMIHDASRLLPWRAILRQIFGAFVESLDETLIYLPSPIAQSWSSRTYQDSSNALSVISAGTSRRELKKRYSLDAAAQAAAVAFARRELKRAYAGGSVSGEEGGGIIKRLRQEIARDRTSSLKYQQFLRREMGKWSSADDTFPVLS